MVTLSQPYRSWASQGGEDQGGTAGSVRAQNGRSVEVERPFCEVEVSLLRASMVTLSDPYRSLASQGGEDQGDIAGPFVLKMVVLLGRTTILGRGCVSLKSVLVTLSDPYRSLASHGGDDQGEDAGPFALKVVVLLQ